MICSMAAAAADNTCSQLSTTMSMRRPATASATVSMTGVSPCGVMPRALAMASGTAPGSPTGASSTSHTPSGNSSASLAATATPSRVFPTPPTPLSVTSWWARASVAISISTWSRPIKVATDLGRLPRRTSRLTPPV